VADKLYRVELTASFLERLDAIQAFLVEADAGFAFDTLLAELRATVIPNPRLFPCIGGAILPTFRSRRKRWHSWPRYRPARRTRCVNTCMAPT